MTDINAFSALIAAASYEREGLGGGCVSMRLPPPLPFFATATSNFIDGKFIKTPKRASAISWQEDSHLHSFATPTIATTAALSFPLFPYPLSAPESSSPARAVSSTATCSTTAASSSSHVHNDNVSVIRNLSTAAPFSPEVDSYSEEHMELWLAEKLNDIARNNKVYHQQRNSSANAPSQEPSSNVGTGISCSLRPPPMFDIKALIKCFKGGKENLQRLRREAPAEYVTALIKLRRTLLGSASKRNRRTAAWPTLAREFLSEVSVNRSKLDTFATLPACIQNCAIKIAHREYPQIAPILASIVNTTTTSSTNCLYNNSKRTHQNSSSELSKSAPLSPAPSSSSSLIIQQSTPMSKYPSNQQGDDNHDAMMSKNNTSESVASEMSDDDDSY